MLASCPTHTSAVRSCSLQRLNSYSLLPSGRRRRLGRGDRLLSAVELRGSDLGRADGWLAYLASWLGENVVGAE